jgi:hypothetical protein
MSPNSPRRDSLFGLQLEPGLWNDCFASLFPWSNKDRIFPVEQVKVGAPFQYQFSDSSASDTSSVADQGVTPWLSSHLIQGLTEPLYTAIRSPQFKLQS